MTKILIKDSKKY